MKTIWKFELSTVDRQLISMPKGAEILSVQTQKETPILWAVVDPLADKEARVLKIVGTGHEISDDFLAKHKFLGTYQLINGSFIGHVFEQIVL